MRKPQPPHDGLWPPDIATARPAGATSGMGRPTESQHALRLMQHIHELDAALSRR